MALEIEELYLSLNTLLFDICKFLKDESNYEKLLPQARQQADDLINRSKLQLQRIAKVSNNTNEYQGAYVDMTRKPSTNSEEDDKNNIYSSVEEPVVQTITVQNPYADLPARELSQDIKYGYLCWKAKIIFNIGIMQRIYGGLHNNWLLVYSNEKQMKPLQTFDLKYHKARLMQCKQGKSPPQDFELFCTTGEKKSFYFMALTYKDMLQWVTQINKCYEMTNNFEITVFEEELSDDYDVINIRKEVEENKEDEEEAIYNDIEIPVYPNKQDKQDISLDKKPPDLPSRRLLALSKKSVPLPPIPTTERKSSSPLKEIASESTINVSLSSRLTSNNSLSKDFLLPPISTPEKRDSSPPTETSTESTENGSEESVNSFSEEDEDNIYEPFVQVPKDVKPPKTEENEGEIYENTANGDEKSQNKMTETNIAKPRISIRPPPLKEKPKILLKRKK